jgi:hypothetical protein
MEQKQKKKRDSKKYNASVTNTNPKQNEKYLTTSTHLYNDMFAEVTGTDIVFISCG